ncbi:C40 family peptidase [Streptomyces sp. NBC_00442]|uniref:C40 family peptidase n=1 Tax=Streptomyces sp. NBC_00442 TaxID=2903651 RepID=UPI002E210E4A
MSHTAHIPSHRKPRRSASKVSLRAGVAGGVLSTIALAGAAAPAIAAQPVTETIEMPTLTGDLATTAAASAQATKAVAADLQLQAAQDAAASTAAKDAKKAKDDAEAKAKAAEAKAKAEAEAKAKAKADATERASRSAERTTLKSTSAKSAGTTSFKASNATGSAAAIVNFALAQVGKAYVSGATGSSAYDCSGLVQAAYRQVGVDLPRVSQDQSTTGTDVSLSNLQPGDILYWGGKGSAYHVAIYVGGGNFVGAQNPSTGVVERSLDYDAPSGAVRVL